MLQREGDKEQEEELSRTSSRNAGSCQKKAKRTLTIVGRTDPKYQIHKDRKEFNTPNMTQLAGIVQV